MKKSIINLLFIFLAIVLVACQKGEVLTFSDVNLETAIREEIEKQNGTLYKGDLKEILSLDLKDKGIKSLDGIEALSNIKILSLENNEITDFAVLKKLEHLEEVVVTGNPFDKDEKQIAILKELADKGIIVVPDINKKEAIVGSPEGPGGFLWKVVNGNTTVYLQGTIHFGVDELYPLNEKIESAYRQADIIMPEIDLMNLNLGEIQRLYMELGMYEDGSVISDHIPKETYSKLEKVFKDFGLPLQIFEMYKPWFLSSTIESLMIEKLGYIEGVDEYFLSRAEEDGKEIIALETVEEQLRIFAESSPEYQLEMLEAVLIDLKEYKAGLKKLIELYMEGNEDELVAYLSEDIEGATEEELAFLKRLNEDRNYGMAEEIIEVLNENSGKTYFVIVGTAHYILDPSIISILEEEGFIVERVH